MLRTVAILLAGCTRVPPFATLETAETLKARAVSVSVGGGAGGGNGGVSCGGGVARARLGLGDDQEVGVDADFIDDGTNGDVGAKLAYKRGLTPNLAMVAGAGATHGKAYGNSAGGDLAIVASTSAPGPRFYGSLRLTGTMPLRSDLYSDGGITEAAFLAGGFASPLDERWTLFGELGGIGSLAERYDNFDSTQPRGTYRNEGFYFAAGLTYTWSR